MSTVTKTSLKKRLKDSGLKMSHGYQVVSRKRKATKKRKTSNVNYKRK